MAKNNAKLVSVGKPMAAGAIFSAPEDTDVPTDATSELKGFTQLGYASDDGLVNGIDTDTDDITAWGGTTVLTVRTSRKETFQFTLLQSLDKDVLAEVYGADNVSGSGNTITVKHSESELPRRVFVFEVLMTGNRVKRITVPVAQVTEVGEVTYSDGDAVAYETTISAYPDEDGVTAYEYIADIDSGSNSSSRREDSDEEASGM